MRFVQYGLQRKEQMEERCGLRNKNLTDNICVRSSGWKLLCKLWHVAKVFIHLWRKFERLRQCARLQR